MTNISGAILIRCWIRDQYQAGCVPEAMVCRCTLIWDWTSGNNRTGTLGFSIKTALKCLGVVLETQQRDTELGRLVLNVIQGTQAVV